METVWEFTYLGDRVSIGGGCETAKIWLDIDISKVLLMECGELLYGRFPFELKGTYKAEIGW